MIGVCERQQGAAVSRLLLGHDGSFIRSRVVLIAVAGKAGSIAWPLLVDNQSSWLRNSHVTEEPMREFLRAQLRSSITSTARTCGRDTRHEWLG